MSNHAILSASSAYRWMACPPSALKNAKIKDHVSEDALQGTDAHSLCEYKVKKALGFDTEDPTPNLEFYDEEMEQCSNDYLNFVLEQKAEAEKVCKDPLILVEQRLDFSRFVPDGFGTGDCLIISDQVLHIIDFKYGAGVLVEAEDNPQMMCYALGAMLLYDGIYDIETIKMSIFQPRKENISTTEISKEELYDWAVNVLQPVAELAASGGGEFKAGNHCRFCKVKSTCRKRAEANLVLAQYDFKPKDELDDIEIEAVLANVDELVSWANDVKDYALKKALHGKKWDGWKVVEGRANRKYKNESEVASIVTQAGFDPYSKKLIGITEMTKLLGKEKFNELLKSQIVKPKGKPTLAPVSDKRKEMNVAAVDFKEGENEND